MSRIKSLLTYDFIFIGLLFLIACSNDKSEEQIVPTQVKVEEEVIIEEITEIKPLVVNYKLIATIDTLNWLKSLNQGDTLDVLLYVNRVDLRNLERLDTIVVPDTISSDLKIYSPFPQKIEFLNEINKLILVSYYSQSFAVYECGEMIRWGPVSLGKASTPTPKGLFFTNWKSKKTYSTVDSTWVLEWYFNFANFDGVSLHEYSLPGYPASHSCVRLFREDAYWFYYWADQWILNANHGIQAYGTPILIYGDYPFGGRKPILKLEKNNQILLQSNELLSEQLKPYLELIFNRQKEREEAIRDIDQKSRILP